MAKRIFAILSTTAAVSLCAGGSPFASEIPDSKDGSANVRGVTIRDRQDKTHCLYAAEAGSRFQGIRQGKCDQMTGGSHYWRIIHSGNMPNFLRIVNIETGKCLSVINDPAKTVGLLPCPSANKKFWQIREVQAHPFDWANRALLLQNVDYLGGKMQRGGYMTKASSGEIVSKVDYSLNRWDDLWATMQGAEGVDCVKGCG
ncbi:hypothetical protein ACFV0H_41410 [Streptomyces erythrochromogenes]|uniref:hypothetical protein n=1 Tax=Streptomyces erythrochromogenes TaxID=285574 RepID=UPI0036BD593F